MTHCTDDDIYEHLDGTLMGEARAQVARHLLLCPTCRAASDEVQRMLKAAAVLPRVRTPEHDLWEGIQRQIEQKRTVVSSDFSRAGWHAIARGTAIAASILVAIGVVSHFQSTAPPGVAISSEEPLPSPLQDEIPPSPQLRAIEAQFSGATRALSDLLNERRAQLQPGTVAVLEQNLDTIDLAIKEIRTALSHQEMTGDTGRLLAAMHQRKIDLLQQAVRLPDM